MYKVVSRKDLIVYASVNIIALVYNSYFFRNSRSTEIIRHKILIQTLSFLTRLPTCQDGVENPDKVYFVVSHIKFDLIARYLYTATRSLLLSGTANIFGLISLMSLGFFLVRVFVCLSEYAKNSSIFVACRSFTSPQHTSRCSLQPRSPKWTVVEPKVY